MSAFPTDVRLDEADVAEPTRESGSGSTGKAYRDLPIRAKLFLFATVAIAVGIIVPLVGFHMPKDELTLDGVQIVRADSIGDLPLDAIEATRSRPGRGSVRRAARRLSTSARKARRMCTVVRVTAC